ncbi:MAG: RnfABCDGE type electron transport complex subunit G [Clostridiaceae bacterium]|nr:RnfABCDGE type electron transport complex subunit G [Clostridiaceae bacterium]
MREYIRLSGTLFVITAVVALVLAIGNNITKDRIAELSKQTTAEAQLTVLGDKNNIDIKSSKQIEYTKPESSVTTITQYQTDDNSSVFAVACSPKGYGGEISMMVGVKDDLTVINISIIDNAKETPGLGSEVGNPEFSDQFIGKGADIKVSKSMPADNEIQAVTGATISSKAVTKGVNDALAAVQEVLNK